MRLKTFSGKTMTDVMAQLRDSMGPDAIIISVEQGKSGSGVRVTAAVDRNQAPAAHMTKAPAPSPALSGGSGKAKDPQSGSAFTTRAFDMADMKAAISHHGLPYDLGERVIMAANAFHAASLADALAHAFDTLMDFSPISLRCPRPLMLAGPPGAGKTVTAAKLAAEARINGYSVTLITTDLVKSGGVQQLDHYASLMDMDIHTAESAEDLQRVLASANSTDLTIIDSCGVNPYSMPELERLVRHLKIANAEPILVLPAGLDPDESADTAGIFAQMGTQRFIATRLDGARRYASLVTTARGGRLALAGISRSPYVAEPLETPAPLLLARLFATLPASQTGTRTKERIA